MRTRNENPKRRPLPRAAKMLGAAAVVVSVVLALVLAAGPGKQSNRTVAARALAGVSFRPAVVPVASHGRRLAAASVTIDLCAKAGSVTLPGPATAPIWGFAAKPSSLPCTDSSVVPGLPGPTLTVNEGDTVTLNVTNTLTEPIALEFPGLVIGPGPIEAAPNASVSYTFTANAPGTYLYRSGANAGRQAAMGLYGALVVRPPTAGRAYDDVDTAFDREALVVLGQIDPNFNANPDSYDFNQWHPVYWLINGKAYPDTAPIDAQPGEKVLLRYVNGGTENLSMTLLGMHERFYGRDAVRLTNPFDAVSDTFAAGSTGDAIVTIPSATALGTSFPLYNRQLHLVNGTVGGGQYSPGGMMTFLKIHTIP